MPDRLLNDILILLIPTLFLAFLWWTARLYELKYEDNVDRLPEWMQIWGSPLKIAKEPSRKTWRWGLVGLLQIVYVIYIVTFDTTPFLIRLFVVGAGLAIFGACVYYCEEKMGR